MDHSGLAFDLRSEVDALLCNGNGHTDGPDVIDRLEQLERCVAHLEAMRADLLVEAADPAPRVERFTVASADGQERRRPRVIQIEDAMREEIAAAVRWSPSHAGSLIANARLLHQALPATLAALRSGAISGRHATVVVEAAGRLSTRHATDPESADAHKAMCAALEERVLRVARRGTVAQTRAAAKRAVVAIDAEGVEQRRRQQRCTRDVRIIEESDGISVLLARLATPAARALMEAVSREAEHCADPGRSGDSSLTAGERRAQALTALVLGAVPPEIRLDVVVPAMGAVSEGALAAAIRAGLGRATMGGAEVVEQDLLGLMADPDVVVTLRKLVADPVTGVLTGCGRSSYRLPARLREFILLRDGTCRFPGCGRAARFGQIDHARPWERGGCTDPENLGPLCTRHHQFKTHGGWRLVTSGADGACTWISPRGRRHRRSAASIVEVTVRRHMARRLAADLSSGCPPGRAAATAPAVSVEYALVQRHRCERSTALDPEPPPF